jgi:transcriptional regulator with XRE-family HTH domain
MADHDGYFADDAATFGDRVAAAREEVGLTKSQLANRLGVRLSTIENWESDRSEPRANKLQMLAGVLNVSIVWLLTGSGAGGIQRADAGGDEKTDAALLSEIRGIRLAQAQLIERLARIERKLRAAVSEEEAEPEAVAE